MARCKPSGSDAVVTGIFRSSTRRANARISKFQTRFCDGGEHGRFRSSTKRAMARNSKFQTRFCDDGAATSTENCPGSCVSMSRQSAIARRLRAWGKAHSFHLRASHKLQCFTKLLCGRQPPVVVPPRIFSEIEIEMVSADAALGFEPTLQVGPEAFDLPEPGRSRARGLREAIQPPRIDHSRVALCTGPHDF